MDVAYAFLKRITSVTIIILLSVTAHANENSATLAIEGYIAERMEVSTQSTANAQNIDLSSTHSVHIGSINYYSNASSGYKITLISKNLGMLKHSKGDRYSGAQYQVFFKNRPLDSNALASNAGATLINQSNAVAEHGSGDLHIKLNGIDNDALVAGTYHDELTVVISAP